ncbi:beta-N-acetylhexosaminidase [Bacillus sp. OV322]|uniref:glycoside hydrolase family 3 protein n=1 Tax=Bacillus sp. OV322 TaxID=1882764 RepID=UPI0008F24DBC|nr:glycoside hydrolase family 3 protein [Bacillus sp. OV322]SFC81805.1 beta-N-acetylhexosaminidase [Bacillus sp. OV322]
MKGIIKIMLVSIAVSVIMFSPNSTFTVNAQMPQSFGLKHLIIDANIPQVKRDLVNNKLQLKALYVYRDGHFTSAEKNVRWLSANKRVAEIDQNGQITFTGKKGTALITVTSGNSFDKISIQKKGDSIEIHKNKSSRYRVIEQAIKHMTLEEKVGQMLMPDFRTQNGKDVTSMLPEIQQQVKDYHLGGVILFRENVVNTEQTTRLVHDYQEASSKYGLLMSIDQEGGVITRLQSGTDMPGNMALGAARSNEITQKVGQAIGEELKALGINMNLAPDLDVNNNPDNPVIGVRSFGEDPELVSSLGNSYIKGLQNSGIAATAKHFPGHGDTAVDSHLGLPEVPYDMDRLIKVELYPFQQAMNAGIDAIMTAHVTFPKIDSTKAISKKDGTEISIPATLSEKVLTGLMRNQMKYKGVIITDAMNMQAISDNFGPVDSAIRAVKAGTDIVLMPVGLKDVAEGLYSAVKKGEIPVSRIEKSDERILALKLNRGILKSEHKASVQAEIQNALKVVGSPQHKTVEKEAAEKSVTLVKNNGALPLKAAKEDKIAVIGSSYVEDLALQVKKHHENVMVIKTAKPLSEQQLSSIKDAKYIILGTNTSTVSGRLPASDQMMLANQLTAGNIPVIGIGIRNPYDIMSYPDADAYLAQYGFRTASFEAAVNAAFGSLNPSGKLPVTIYNQNGSVLYAFGHGLSY